MRLASSLVRSLSIALLFAAACEPDPSGLESGDGGHIDASVDVTSTKQALETGSLCGNMSGLQPNALWGMAGGCPGRNAFASEVGPTSALKRWSFDVFSDVRSSPAVASDGSLIWGSDGGVAYRVDANTGAILQQLTLGGAIKATPALSADTAYLPSASGKLFAIGLNTFTLKSGFPFTTGAAITSSPLILPNGNVVFGSNDTNVYAVSPLGVKVWSTKTGGAVAGAVAMSPDGATVFVASQDKNAYAINSSNGAVRWKRLLGASSSTSAAVTKFNLVIFTAGTSVYAIDASTPTGVIAWQKSLGSSGTVTSPVITREGVVLVGASYGLLAGGSLQAFRPSDGALLFRYDTSGGIEAAPAVDIQGTAYFGTNTGALHAVNAAGRAIFVHTLPNGALAGLKSTPVLAGQGLYFGADDNFLYGFSGLTTLAPSGATCTADSDCAPNLLCGSGNGPRFGKPAATGVCVPSSCLDKVLSPGETEIDCGGPLCGSCTNICSNACSAGSQVTPPALEVLSFSKGAFSRGSAGSYQTSANTLALARGDQLRWEDRGEGNGRVALFEGPRTNRMVWSESMSHAPDWWTGAPQTPTMILTEDAAVSPTGLQTADRWQAQAGGNASRAQTIVNAMPAGSLSTWLRLTDPTSFNPTNPLKTRVVLTDLTGGWYNEPKDWVIPGAWERRSMVTTPATKSTAVQMSHKGAWPGSATQFPALPAADFNVFGWQLEEGKFPSSYIPTKESAVTRKVDQVLFETVIVPTWLRTGKWQIDVLPLYSSTEIATTDEFVLMSWEGGGQISLAKDAAGGRLRIVSGTANAGRTIAWTRNRKITLTVDTVAKTVQVLGASSGDGSLAYGAIAIATGRVGIGALMDGSKPAFARISEPRKVASPTVACVADPDCVVCGDGFKAEGIEVCDTALDARCKADCSGRGDPHECFGTDNLCPTGTECPDAPNGSAFDALSTKYFCVPITLCTEALNPACGDALTAPCGRCPCTPTCAGKRCGDSPSDGCGGFCEAYCGEGEGGCTGDWQCRAGSTGPLSCVRGAGERVGLSPNLNVCLPPICLTADASTPPNCGSATAPCKACPACVPSCDGKQCGSNGCGGSCGTCGAGTECNSESMCLPKPIITLINGAPPLLPFASAPVGATKGKLEVGDDGAASYTIPIVIPPGRKGFEPRLSLQYNSLRYKTASYLGMGWSLGGLSSIARCPKTAIQDGVVSPVTFTPEDALCLDGVRLVPIRKVRTEVELRTELDSHVRVIAHLDPEARNITSFDAYLPDGTKRLYGTATASGWAYKDEIGNGIAFHWALKTEVNALGHSIHYNYETVEQRQAPLVLSKQCDSDPSNQLGCLRQPLYMSKTYTAVIRPKSIYYGGVGCVGSLALCFSRPGNHLSVKFEYENLSVPAGHARPRVLVGITAHVDGSLVRRYAIDYGWQSAGHPRPKSVRECDAAGVCLPETTFGYQGGELAPGRLSATSELLSSDGPGKYHESRGGAASQFVASNGIHTLDANGDGLGDVLFNRLPNVAGGAPDYRLLLSNGDGSTRDTGVSLPLPRTWWNIPAAEQPSHIIDRMVFSDFTGDGRDDVLMEYVIEGDTSRSFLAIFRSTGSSFSKLKEFEWYDGGDPDERLDSWVSYDADGDGWDDVVTCLPDDGVARISWNDGGTFSSSRDVPLEGAKCTKTLVLDADGDGVVEFLAERSAGAGKGTYLYALDVVSRAQASWINTYVALSGMLTGNEEFATADIDGDGRTDILAKVGSKVRFWHNRAWGFENITRSTPWVGSVTDQPTAFGLYPTTAFLFSSAEDLNSDGSAEIYFPSFPLLTRLYTDGAPYVGKWFGLSPLTVSSGEGAFRGFASPPNATWIDASYLFAGSEYQGTPGEFSGAPVHLGLSWTDINGDGQRDAVYVERSYYGLTGGRVWEPEAKSRIRAKLAFPERSLLTHVTDGLGHVDEIGYADAVGSSYQTTSTCVDTKSMCLRALPVGTVSGTTERTARGPAVGRPDLTSRYWYFDGRVERAGRGGLGFSKRAILTKTTDGSERFSVVSYDLGHQTYSATVPLTTAAFAKVPKRIEVLTQLKDGRASDVANPIWRLEVTERDLATRTSDGGRPFVVENGRTVLTYEAAVAVPVERNATVSFEALFDTPLASVDQGFDVDQFGNTTVVSSFEYNGEATGAPARARISRVDYTPTADELSKWQVSYPKNRETITSTPGSAIKTQFETYAYTNGVLTSLTRAFLRNGAPFVTMSMTPDAEGNVHSAEIQDPLQAENRAIVYEYDSRLMYATKVTHHVGGGSVPLVSEFDYSDTFGSLQVIKDPAGVLEFYGYDGFGRLAWHEEGSGRETSYRYEATGPNCERCTMWVRENSGNGFPVPSGDGETLTGYDAFGNQLARRFRGHKGVWVEELSEYDMLGRLVSQSLPRAEGNTTAQGKRSYEYDNLGRVTRMTDGVADTEYSYASANTLSEELSPFLSMPAGWQAGAARWFAMIYDGGTNTTAVDVMDATGNVIAKHEGGAVRRYTYDGFDSLHKVTLDGQPEQTRTNVADAWGRLVSTTDPDAGTYQFTYYGTGELRTEQSPTELVSYSHDGLGRIKTRTASEGTARWYWDRHEGLSAPGRLVQTEAPNHRRTLQYDAVTGMLVSTTDRTNNQSFTTTLYRDPMGRPDLIQYPARAGLKLNIRHEYDDWGNLEKLRDNDVPATQRPYWVLAVSDQGYRVGTERLGNGFEVVRVYEAARGYLASVRSRPSATGTLNGWGFGYNSRGQLTSQVASNGSTSKGYQYSPEGRLTGVTTGLQSGAQFLERYDYSALGRMESTGRKGTYSYVHPDNIGGPNAVATTQDGWSFWYDGKGNQVRRVRPGVEQTLAYTSFNLPSLIEQVIGGVSETFEFDYDAFGKRRSKRGERAETYYVDDLYRETMVAGATQSAEYALNVNGRQIGTVRKTVGSTGEQVSYFMDDPTGSPLAIISGTGSVNVSREAYGLANDGASDAGRRFGGHDVDSELGLVDMGGRLYDANLGRFISADPFIQDPFRADSLNRYVYGWNAPTGYVDPTGFQTEIEPPVGSGSDPSVGSGNTGTGRTAGGFTLAPGVGGNGIPLAEITWRDVGKAAFSFAGGVGNAFTANLFERKYHDPSNPTAYALGQLVGSGVGLFMDGMAIIDGLAAIGAGGGGGILLAIPSGGMSLAPGAVLVTGGAAAVGAGGAAGVAHVKTAHEALKSLLTFSKEARPTAPAPGNYRGRYNAARSGEGKSRLPNDWDAHHSIPQEYRNHPEFADFDFDAPSNIRGVQGSRSETNIHQAITNEWADFRAANPNATRSAIEAFARGIDVRYSVHWW